MADALVAAVLGSTVGQPTTPLTPKVRLNVLVPLGDPARPAGGQR